MAESSSVALTTKRHDRLLRIASVANVFSWLVLIFYILTVTVKFLNTMQSYYFQNGGLGIGCCSDFFVMLSKNWLYAGDFFLSLLSMLLRGLVLALILKGISLALNMIVETNLNYKIADEESGNE